MRSKEIRQIYRLANELVDQFTQGEITQVEFCDETERVLSPLKQKAQKKIL